MQDGECLEKEEIKTQALRAVSQFEYYLRQLRGNFECGEAQSQYFTFPNLAVTLAEQLRDVLGDSGDIATEEAYTTQILKNFVTGLNDQSFGWDIHWKAIEGEDKSEDFELSVDTDWSKV